MFNVREILVSKWSWSVLDDSSGANLDLLYGAENPNLIEAIETLQRKVIIFNSQSKI